MLRSKQCLSGSKERHDKTRKKAEMKKKAIPMTSTLIKIYYVPESLKIWCEKGLAVGFKRITNRAGKAGLYFVPESLPPPPITFLAFSATICQSEARFFFRVFGKCLPRFLQTFKSSCCCTTFKRRNKEKKTRILHEMGTLLAVWLSFSWYSIVPMPE